MHRPHCELSIVIWIEAAQIESIAIVPHFNFSPVDLLKCESKSIVCGELKSNSKRLAMARPGCASSRSERRFAAIEEGSEAATVALVSAR